MGRTRGRRRRGAAVVIMTVVLTTIYGAPATVGPRLARAAAPAPHPQLCAWPRVAVGAQHQGNVGGTDTAATELLTTFGYVVGSALRIQGQFPYARYMSFTVYAGRSLVLIDHLDDQAIVPDRGSTNPFRPGANRRARRRSYTVSIQQGAPPLTGRAPNTLYTGPYHPLLVLYRVYAPDQGADVYGNVPKPRVTVVLGTLGAGQHDLALPICAHAQPAQSQAKLFLVTPLLWHRFQAQQLTDANPDTAYLQTRLDTDEADEFVLHFKAPTFADTYVGRRINHRAEVRAWSICVSALTTLNVIACLHDDQAVISRQGYVTIDISTLANRPSTASAAHGVNWLPLGPEQLGLVTYRQLLPRPTFRGSFFGVEPRASAKELQTTLGPYLPTMQTCSLQSYTPQACLAGVYPLGPCSDLLEPDPCGTSAPAAAAGALSPRRAGLAQAVLLQPR